MDRARCSTTNLKACGKRGYDNDNLCMRTYVSQQDCAACVHICMHTCLHTHMHAYMSAYVVCILPPTSSSLFSSLSSHRPLKANCLRNEQSSTYECVHAYAHGCIHVCIMHTCPTKHMHACILIHVCTYSLTYTRMHATTFLHRPHVVL